MPLQTQDLRLADIASLKSLEADRSLSDLDWRAVVAELARRESGGSVPLQREGFWARSVRKFHHDYAAARAKHDWQRTPGSIERRLAAVSERATLDRVEVDLAMKELGAKYEANKPAIAAVAAVGLFGILLMVFGVILLGAVIALIVVAV